MPPDSPPRPTAPSESDFQPSSDDQEFLDALNRSARRSKQLDLSEYEYLEEATGLPGEPTGFQF